MIAAYRRTATHYKHFCMFGFAVSVELENHAQRFGMCGNLQSLTGLPSRYSCDAVIGRRLSWGGA